MKKISTEKKSLINRVRYEIINGIMTDIYTKGEPALYYNWHYELSHVNAIDTEEFYIREDTSLLEQGFKITERKEYEVTIEDKVLDIVLINYTHPYRVKFFDPLAFVFGWFVCGPVYLKVLSWGSEQGE